MSDRADDPVSRTGAIDRSRLARSLSPEAAARLKTVAGKPGLRLTKEESDPGVKAAKPGRTDYLTVKAALLERLLDEIGERGLLDSDNADVAAAVKDFAARAIESEAVPLNQAERVRLAEELTDETIGMGPLAPLIADPAISDILVNGPDKVYVERFGRLEKTDVRFRDADHIVRVIERIAARVGRRIDAGSPMADLPRRSPGPRHFLSGHSGFSCDRGPRAQEHPHLRRHRRRQVDAVGGACGSDTRY